MPDAAPRLTAWFRCTGLGLLIWGTTLAVIDRFGSDVPYWDQWDAEGAQLYVPYEHGTLGVGNFLLPHNEHRIVLTRVLTFGLFVANGQWDARLQCVVNAALHAALGVVVFAWGRRAIAPRWHLIWLLVVVCLTAPPVSWENVLSGFNSQQYLLIACSLAAIALLGTATAGSARWWAGVGVAGLALCTMASGLLAAATVGGGLVLVACRDRPGALRHAPTLLVCGLLVAAGLWLYTPAPAHSSFQAGSLGEFAAAFHRYLAWPFERPAFGREVRVALLPALQWLPWLWLGWRLWRQGPASAPVERVIWAAGVWALLQFAVSAYARGAGAPRPPSRYVDTLLVGLAVTWLALALLRMHCRLDGWRRRLLVGGAIVGNAAAFIGVGVHVGYHLVQHLPQRRDQLARGTERVRAYLATGDAAHLQSRDIPYPHPAVLAARLDEPAIRAILPVSLQADPARIGPLSRLAAALARGGVAIAALGFALLILAQWRERRPE